MNDTKVIFVGNSLAGDDGIGPHLYTELKDELEKDHIRTMELGVAGLDMLSYVDDCNVLVIVDAVHKGDDVGKVSLLMESDIKPATKLVSQHDLGVQETIKLIKDLNKKIKKIIIVGVSVKETHAFDDKLSKELSQKLSKVKKEVKEMIIKIHKDEI